MIDHDGDAHSEGGIKRWLKLAEATGLNADEVRAGAGILPATRFAVNEYLNIVRSRSLLEAVASSLTELFSRDLISLRMDKLRQHYPWLSGGLDYFEARLTQAPDDAKFAINYVYENAKTRAEQELAIQNVAMNQGITIDKMKEDVRDTLLDMWREWSGRHSLIRRTEKQLLHLLRQQVAHGAVRLRLWLL